MRTRASLLLFLVVVSAAGQALRQYTPVSGETYETVLNELFPGHKPALDTRFQITLRILPPFAAELEINITYMMDRKGCAVLTTPSKPLRQVLDDYAATGAPHDAARLASLVQITNEAVEIDGDIVRGWLKEFWRSVSNYARTGPARTLKYDGTHQVEVALDATLYQIFYSDAETHLQISVPGPDPGWSGDLRKSAPIVRWVLEVRRQIEARRTRRSRG